jgi:hypothetical protein
MLFRLSFRTNALGCIGNKLFPLHLDAMVTMYQILLQVGALDKPMPRDRDEKTGKYTEKYPIEDFLSAIDSLNGAAGTQKVADEVGCAYRTAYAKLTELEKEEKINSRKVGNAKLWEYEPSEED